MQNVPGISGFSPGKAKSCLWAINIWYYSVVFEGNNYGYIYSLNTSIMVKNIIIGVLLVGVLFLVVFANLKASEAERQKQVAEQYATEAQLVAEKAAAEARRLESIAIMQKEKAEELNELLNQSDLGQEVLKLQFLVKEYEQAATTAAAEARMQLAESLSMKESAESSQEEAEQQRAMAEQAMQEAQNQISELKKLLTACQNQ
jgi:cell division septum initiation protein DivIVA